MQDVLTEVAQLADKGVREINLLGQNVNGYRGRDNAGAMVNFAELITYVADIDGIDRIRYTTSHPLEFSDDLIEVYAKVPELVDHLHLPIQSGSDRILAAMKRNHTVLEYKSKVRKLLKIRPNLSMSSDFIVGFPGEGEKEFEETMNLISDINYDTSYSFIYSKRPGTPAADLPDDVSMETKKQRLFILQQRINQQAQKISRDMVGTTQRLLINGASLKDPSEIQGRTENNRVVNLKGDLSLVGKFVDVEIYDALPNSLRGNII